VNELADDECDHDQPEKPRQQSSEPEPGPVGEPAVGEPLEAAEKEDGPEPVAGPPVLADQEVDLPHCLVHLGLDRVRESDERVIRQHGPDQAEPDQAEYDEELDPFQEP
jgi:hypothetical protein